MSLLFITLYKASLAVAIFQFVDKIPKWDYSNESFEHCCQFVVLLCINICSNYPKRASAEGTVFHAKNCIPSGKLSELGGRALTLLGSLSLGPVSNSHVPLDNLWLH